MQKGQALLHALRSIGNALALYPMPVTVVGAVDGSYVEEDDLTEAGKIDYARVRPVLFEFPTYSYLRTGDVIGPCADFAREARA